MTRPLLALAFLIAPLLLGQEAAAQEAAPEPGVAGRGTPRLRKLEVARRLLADPAIAQRIEAAGDAEAKRLWASAHEKVEQAEALLRERGVEAADPVLNEALQEIGRVRRAFADPDPERSASRLRYGERLDSVQSLYASFKRRALESGGGQELAESGRLAGRIAEARDLAAAERTGEAAGILAAAEKDLLVGLNRLLAAEAAELQRRARTPAEVYQWQLARNRSYAELVPVAVAHLKPSADALKEIGRNVRENLRLRDEARQDAAGLDYRSAADKLASGISLLQRALAQAGMAPAPNPGE